MFLIAISLPLLLIIVSASAQLLIPLTSLQTLCGQYENYTTASGLYTFLTNEWGADGSGTQCINFGENPDHSSNYTASSATWNWGKARNSVHAFPNINLNSPLPIQLGNLSTLNLDVEWSIAPGSESRAQTDPDGLAAVGAITDVALDLFLDPNATRANSTTKPEYEVMVWLGGYGGVVPIGYREGTDIPTYRLAGTNFKLYDDPNGHGQHVYSWLTAKNLTSLAADVSPLIHSLWRHGFIPRENYLGIVQFGSEEFHTDSGHNVTFSARKVLLELVPGSPRAESNVSALRPQVVWLTLTLMISLSLCI